MQNAEPDYAKDPEVPKHVTIQDSTENKTKEFQAALAAEKKKRRSRPWLVAILSLLLIGLGAATAIYVYTSYFEKTTTNNAPNSVVADSPSSTKVTASKAVNEVKKVFIGESDEVTKPLFAIQIPGFAYNTDLSSDKDYVGVSGNVPAADNTVKLAELGRALKDQGLSEQIDPANTEVSYTARYTGSDAVCIVTSLGSYDNRNAAHVVQAACANMETFKAVATAQKPFYEATKNSLEYSVHTALYGEPVVKKGATNGYSVAELIHGVANLGAGSSVMMFYQLPDKTWHYVASKPDVGPSPQCSDFKTSDAKKAYAGTPCYNDSTASTVTP